MHNSKRLTMTFDPKTIEHLGVKMYSTLPPVLAELVANSFDAGAKKVFIDLEDSGPEKMIKVSDDGSGMSLMDIDNNFLVIGRNRRLVKDTTPVKGRKPIGKKGLGKLAFFGIANAVSISSVKEGLRNKFEMTWEEILSEEDGAYSPTLLLEDVPVKEDTGTVVTLSDIRRKTDFDATDIAHSLSRMFIVDEKFSISVRRNNENYIEVRNEMKYESIDVEIDWKIPESEVLDAEYAMKKGISGHIFAAQKPVAPGTQMRGITLFSRKKLVNLPEYFSESQSSHFYSYVSGWLEVDFIDELGEDVISTDRQSLIWDHPDIRIFRDKLQEMMKVLEKNWRGERSKRRTKELNEKTEIDLEKWYSLMPNSVRKKVEPIIKAIVSQSEFDEDERDKVVGAIKSLAPEYTFFHYRNLHPMIKKVAGKYYKKKDYYTAFLEAMKKYVNESRGKSGMTPTRSEMNDIEHIYQVSNPILSVISAYKKPDGSEFSDDTKENIVSAHRMFSVGSILGGRHPLSHEEICDLEKSELFTESDCLDALSLLSHLFRRLDNSVKIR